MVFSYHAVSLASDTYNYVSEHSVIHIYTSFVDNRICIYSECITLLYMIVKHCRQKIVCGCYSMKISCKMEIQLIHRYYLRKSAACSSSLYTETRSKRRLSKCYHGLFAKLFKALSKSYKCSGLTLSCRCRIDSCNKYKLAFFVFFARFQKLFTEFCLIFAVHLKVVKAYPVLACHICNIFHLNASCNFDITTHTSSLGQIYNTSRNSSIFISISLLFVPASSPTTPALAS